MISKSIKLLVCAVLLSGAFASQALWQNENNSANPDVIDSITAGVAVCPEIAHQVRSLLDAQQGQLHDNSAKQMLLEIEACQRQRSAIGLGHHQRLAYAALHELLASHQTDQGVKSELSLRLTYELSPQ